MSSTDYNPTDFTRSTRKSIENSVETKEQWLQFNRSKPMLKFLSYIQRGVFGSVQKMYDLKNQKIVAVKRKVKNKRQESRETDLLTYLRKSYNVINVQDVFQTSHDEYKNALIQNIVMEYMPTALQKVLDDKFNANLKMSSFEIKCIQQQMLNGCREMHLLNIAHRDLKPDNILMKKNEVKQQRSTIGKKSKKTSTNENDLEEDQLAKIPWLVKIADVGCAKALEPLPLCSEYNVDPTFTNVCPSTSGGSNFSMAVSGNTTASSGISSTQMGNEPKKKHTVLPKVDTLQTPHCISLWQRPPELLAGMCDQSTKIDIWAIGCMLYELYSLKSLFRSKDEGNQMALIIERMGTPDINVLKKWRLANPMMFDQVLSKLPIMKGMGLATEMEELMGLTGVPPNEGGAARQEMKQMLDLTYSLLHPDFDQRFTAEEALRHPYFDSVRGLFPHVEKIIGTKTAKAGNK